MTTGGQLLSNTGAQQTLSLRSKQAEINQLTVVRVRGAHLNQTILPTFARYPVHGDSLVCPRPQPDALGPGSGSVGRDRPAFQSRAPRETELYWRADSPPSPRDPPPHHLSPELGGEGWRGGVASETPSQWEKRAGGSGRLLNPSGYI